MVKKFTPKSKISALICASIISLFLVSFLTVLPKNSYALNCSVNGSSFTASGQMTVNAGDFPSNSGDRDWEIRLFGTSGTNAGQPTTVQTFKPNSTTFPLTVTVPNVSQGTYDIELRDILATINIRCAQNVSVNNNGTGTGGNPSCSLVLSTVEKGQNMTLTGNNLMANTQYDIYSGSTKGATVKTNSAGGFTKQVKTTKEGGPYQIKLVSHMSAADLQCGSLTVTAPKGAQGENPCKTGKCKTGLGDISTDPQELIKAILTLATSVGGGFAFLLMVIGSIKVLTSSGDQQKLSGGKDMIVAAIAGLLFIIFSVLILRFIGINLLGGVIS